MKEYKIKYLNEISAFNTVGNEVKGLPGLGKGSQNSVTGEPYFGPEKCNFGPLPKYLNL